ncbi:hypothetical protein [Magnetospirillum moscoviense]|uniref:Outer membrane protein beta-barrel domain-containing protein n=1 Tax=Magnetospirillum moscoviense TaxID=1437059 RepID=A0A178N0I9_9PROT|nr:hypothetical protein [Magnetospirillum moscoviense]OAN59540.1 hypothetical protein A6A05_07310 [Magnetospirillum moscoviense]
MRLLTVLCVCALAAAPAFAEDGASSRPRLVGGGIDLLKADFARGAGMGESQAEIFGKGAFSAGAVSGPERMAIGGYTSYMFNDIRLSSSLKSDPVGHSADLSAAYSGAFMGIDGTALVRMGYEWGSAGSFSPNPAQMGVTAFDGYRPGSDLSLSLSLTHDITPGFSFGGFAAANRGEVEAERAQSGFSLGAGLGLKF